MFEAAGGNVRRFPFVRLAVFRLVDGDGTSGRMTTPLEGIADAVGPVRASAPSLPESFASIAVPGPGGSFWRKFGAFAGPGYLVAVGYMDPGNWATDLAGGSAFGYRLLCLILLSNPMAVLLQGLSSKLGIVTGREL